MISEKEIRQRRSEFENFLMHNDSWRKDVANVSFDEMYGGVDLLEKALIQLRFTDPRTLQKMREMSFPTEGYQIYTPGNLTESVVLPPQVWRGIQETVFKGGDLKPVAANFIIDYFKKKAWTLEGDIPTQRNLRRKIQANVPDKITHVPAGSRIIDQGEKVTARHVAMLQAMKDSLSDQRNLWSPLTLVGSAMLAILLTALCSEYFRINHPQLLSSNRKLFLLVTIIILTFAIAKATEFFLLSSSSNWIDIVRYPLFLPFAVILIGSLINPAIATFVGGLLVVVLTMSLAFDRQDFMILNIVAALAAILSIRSLRKRKEIFIVCGKAWLGCLLVIVALHFYENTLWSGGIFADVLSAAVCMLLTAVLVVGLLPLLESSFRIMTDVTLMEYMDPNSELLRRLTIEAPGTYQHSVVVGNLAEAAAIAIGANGLFCRVATLYHDIGKMVTPQYFTENQQNGMNIHQLLTPKESAHVIMAHVPEGVSMARKAGLPEQFIDIIKEHHGTSLVYFFYRKELEKSGEDRSLVDEKDFRYAGPKPRSKESAIIMIADSVEAASRSLDQITEDALMELASRLIRDKAEDGQFDNCLLTFEELAIVKSTLVKTLVAYGHARVKYPIRETKKEDNSLSPSYEA
jgi:hypothetical protein